MKLMQQVSRQFAYIADQIEAEVKGSGTGIFRPAKLPVDEITQEPARMTIANEEIGGTAEGLGQVRIVLTEDLKGFAHHCKKAHYVSDLNLGLIGGGLRDDSRKILGRGAQGRAGEQSYQYYQDESCISLKHLGWASVARSIITARFENQVNS